MIIPITDFYFLLLSIQNKIYFKSIVIGVNIKLINYLVTEYNEKQFNLLN